jgi:hypothetical protein
MLFFGDDVVVFATRFAGDAWEVVAPVDRDSRGFRPTRIAVLDSNGAVRSYDRKRRLPRRSSAIRPSCTIRRLPVRAA